MNIVLFEDEKPFVESSAPVYFHILNILHLKEGDEFKCGIINKSKGRARIKSISQKYIEFDYIKEEENSKFLDLYLALAYIRPICAKRVCRAASQVGLKKIVFFPTKLNEKSYSESNFYRERQACEFLKEGAMISGDYLVPELLLLEKFDDLISFSKKENIKNNYLLEIDKNLKKLDRENQESSMLTIGPERGWTQKELSLLEAAGFLKRKLSDRILRSEEACIVSLFPFL